MKIYLSARYSEQIQMRKYRTELEGMGHIVTSRWLDERYASFEEVLTHEEILEIAIRDLDDIQDCDVLIAFTYGGKTSHGVRFHEQGYAQALDKELWLVGEPENCMQELFHVKFADWNEAAVYATCCEALL